MTIEQKLPGDELLKRIAEVGYNAGFGAKRNFASYDILKFIPGLVSFLTMAGGIICLVAEGGDSKYCSAVFLILGLVGFICAMKSECLESYNAEGKRLTILFNELGNLYAEFKSGSEEMMTEAARANAVARLSDLQRQLIDGGISDQVMFSGWFAHYKFFREMNIGWVDEQMHFELFKDKLPLSFIIFVLLCIVALSVWLIWL